jgi:hypothetical protein
MGIKLCCDQIGNELHEGDLVYIDPTNKVLIGEIAKVEHGGIGMTIDRVTPAHLIIVIEVELMGEPGKRFPGIFALRHPIATKEPVVKQ